MISEEEFKRRISKDLMFGQGGCSSTECWECCVDFESCKYLPNTLRSNCVTPFPNAALFQAYLDGRIVIVNREWCVVEED